MTSENLAALSASLVSVLANVAGLGVEILELAAVDCESRFTSANRAALAANLSGSAWIEGVLELVWLTIAPNLAARASS